MQPKMFEIPKIGAPSLGYISVIQNGNDLPFEVKRVYWTYFTPNHVERGNHAHINLQQLIIAVSGVIDFTLIDRERNRYDFTLDSPEKVLYVPNGYWREIRFSHSAVLLCLASDTYDEKDYIRDPDLFFNA